MAELIQLSLPDHAAAPRNDLEAKYRVWRATHEKVFGLFERFTLEMMQYRRRFGMRLIQERVRWEVRTTWGMDVDGFKVNDHYPPYIARDLIAKYPALADLIETRTLRGEEENEL